jgi:predicted RNA-binding Zn-ribbon protein involved in translation (DUF1610 family)
MQKRRKSEATVLKKQVIKREKLQTLDLATIEGDGSFACPNCGTMISPDDESEELYRILDTKVVGDELAELVISCGTCGTVIKLTGFQQALEA